MLPWSSLTSPHDERRSGRTPMDPRYLVVAASVAAIVVVSVFGGWLLRTVDVSQRQVHYVSASLAVPLGDLEVTYQADLAGETSLQTASATVGTARSAALSTSVYAAESATKAWTAYRSSSLDLHGEAVLAARYERDFAAGQAVASNALVPIVRSNVPMALPVQQVDAADLDRQDLTSAIQLYETARGGELTELNGRTGSAHAGLLIGAIVLMVLALFGGLLGLRGARRTVSLRRERAAAAKLETFEARLSRALEFANDDVEACAVVARAAAFTSPEAAAAVLITDPSGTTFLPIIGKVACGAERPTQCPAIKAGGPLRIQRQFITRCLSGDGFGRRGPLVPSHACLYRWPVATSRCGNSSVRLSHRPTSMPWWRSFVAALASESRCCGPMPASGSRPPTIL